MDFIEINTEDGIVLIQLAQVAYVELEEDGSTIHLINDDIISSTEMYEDIKQKIYNIVKR